MTDVVAPELPVGAPPEGFSRVRCSSCAMPVRGSQSTCWSCGLDPTLDAHVEASSPEVGTSSGRGRSSGQRLLGGAGLALLVVVLLGCVTVLASPDRSRGVRGLSARIRGDAWQRADVLGGSAEFPAPPMRRTVALGLGRPLRAEVLTAEAPGLRTELLAADMAGTPEPVETTDVADMAETVGRRAQGDPLALAERLLSAYSVAAGGRVAHVASRPAATPGLDALVAEPRGDVRVRVSMAGMTGYLMAVTGPVAVFDRFAESFQHLGPPPAAAPPTT